MYLSAALTTKRHQGIFYGKFIELTNKSEMNKTLQSNPGLS